MYNIKSDTKIFLHIYITYVWKNIEFFYINLKNITETIKYWIIQYLKKINIIILKERTNKI